MAYINRISSDPDEVTAETYFANRIGTSAWDNADEDEKDKALEHATSLIDNLNFIGDKASDSQDNQFPRGDDTEVPLKIKYACCEIAKKLLDGVDIEKEANDVLVSEHRMSTVITQKDSKTALPWVMAGIPSYQAWIYLTPFLIDSRELVISRF